MDYHIIVETHHKRFLWFFKRLNYQRPIVGFLTKEEAERRFLELKKLHGIGLYSFHIEMIRCNDY